MANLKQDIRYVLSQIESYLVELEMIRPTEIQQFQSWQNNVQQLLLLSFTAPEISQQFIMKSKMFHNKWSEADNRRNMQIVKQQAEMYLQQLVSQLQKGEYSQLSVEIEMLDFNRFPTEFPFLKE